jgi:uncharacterized protein (TIGR02271 family)
MSRTITAFFDSRSDAESARMRLTEAGIDASQIIDQGQSGSSGMSSGSTSSSSSSSSSSSEGQGFWASIKEAFMPDEDRYAYEEGMRRGGYLLCAQVEESQADEAIRILDDEGTVDFDRRQDEWKSQGWSGYTGGTQSSAGQSSAGMTSQNQSSARSGNTVEEERIPIVEEQLQVGKREVARGGARVRSYVREVPVHEQVNLREEHVSVERRPVDQKLGAADLNSGDLLRDRTIEMTETSEEAVVGKQARVTEEVVVKKTAEERVEQIDDTVRRTEVDVDNDMRAGSEDRSAFGFKEGGTGSGQGSTSRTGSGTGATGFDSKDPTPAGTGYSDRIDKSGL